MTLFDPDPPAVVDVPDGSTCFACAVTLPVLAALFLDRFDEDRFICKDEAACARRSVALCEAECRLGFGRKTHDEPRRPPIEVRELLAGVDHETRLRKGLHVCDGCGEAGQASGRYCALCGAAPKGTS